MLWTLQSVGWSVAGPAEEALVADLSGRQVRGAGYGFYMFTEGLGATLGALLGGWLYDTMGHTVPFYLNSAVLLLGAALILLLLRRAA